MGREEKIYMEGSCVNKPGYGQKEWNLIFFDRAHESSTNAGHMWQAGGNLVWNRTQLLLTPDNDIDVLASRVAHIVDRCAVVESGVSRSDRPQDQRWPSDQSTEGKGSGVTHPGDSGSREARGDVTGHLQILPRIHHHCVVHRQPDHGRRWRGETKTHLYPIGSCWVFQPLRISTSNTYIEHSENPQQRLLRCQICQQQVVLAQ